MAAVNALIAGGTHEDAALASGVHRVTVTRWVNHHPAFVAEMNRVRADLASKTQARSLGSASWPWTSFRRLWKPVI